EVRRSKGIVSNRVHVSNPLAIRPLCQLTEKPVAPLPPRRPECPPADKVCQVTTQTVIRCRPRGYNATHDRPHPFRLRIGPAAVPRGPGLGGSARAPWFHPGAPAVADRYHVIPLDQRGHGASQWAPGPAYATEDFAE